MIENMFLEEVKISEKYTISEELIIDIIDKIEAKIGDNVTKKRKRIFYTTLTELIQNINNYTEESKNFENKLEIRYNSEDKIIIKSSNLISNTNKKILTNKLYELKGLDKAELNKKYDEILHDGNSAQNRKNGLGIILAAKNAKEMQYKFESTNNHLFKFQLTLTF